MKDIQPVVHHPMSSSNKNNGIVLENINKNKNSKEDYHFIQYDNGVHVNIPRKEYEKHMKLFADINATKNEKTRKQLKLSKKQLSQSIDRLFNNKKKIYCGTLPPINGGQCPITDHIIFTNKMIAECEAHFQSLTLVVPQVSIVDRMMTPDALFLTKLLEDILVTIKLVCYSKSKTDYAFAVYVFAKLRLAHMPLFQSLFMEDMAQYLINLITGDDATPSLQSSEDKTEEMFNSLHDLLNKYDSVKKSPLVKKLYKFSMYALSLSLFQKAGIDFDTLKYSKLEEEAIKSKYHLGPDFIHCLLDTILFLTQRGYQCYKMGCITPMFHSPKTYEQFYVDSQSLIQRSKCMHNPALFGDDEFTFRADLDKALEKGQAMVKYAFEIKGLEKDILRRVVNELHMIKCDLMTRAAAKETREPPFSLLISGNSSIGKSSLMDMIYTHFGKKQKLPIGSEYKYTRNAAANFWDGFSTSQWCIVFDDIAFMHPNKAPQGDQSLMEIIQLINAVPFTPDQASLEDKGKTPVRAKLVVASTNTEDLNAHFYFSCGSAVQRRFPFIIEPHVKKEYLADDSLTLDSSKCPLNTGYPDLWTFNIKKVTPTPIKNGKSGPAKITTILSDINLVEFLTWLNSAIDQHQFNQASVTASLDVMKNVELCDNCNLPKDMCKCSPFVLESDEVPWMKQKFFMFEAWGAYDYAWAVLTGMLMFVITTHVWFSVAYGFSGPFTFRMSVKLTEWLVKNVYHTERVQAFLGENHVGRLFAFALHRKFGIRPTDTFFKKVFKKAGARVLRYLSTPGFLLHVATLLVVSNLLMKIRDLVFSTIAQMIFKPHSCMVQEETEITSINSRDIGQAPQPKGEETENVWYKNDYEISSFDYTPEQIGSHGLTLEQFVQSLEYNVVCLKMNSQERSSQFVTTGVCLRDNIYILNTHAIPPDNVIELELLNSPSKDGVTNNVSMVVYKSNFNFIGNDLSIIRLDGIPPRKDITKYFNTCCFEGVWNGILLGRRQNGKVNKNALKRICKKDATWLEEVKGKHWEYVPFEKTEYGDCGSLIVCDTPRGFVIVGLHYAGTHALFGFNNPHSAGINVTQSILGDIEEHFPKAPVPSQPSLESKTAKAVLGELHRKSPFRYIDHGSCSVYGSFKGFRCQPKSTVCRTIVSKYLEDNHNYKIKYTKPSMRGWEAKRKSLLDVMSMEHKFNQDILDMIVENMSQNIIKKLGDKIKDLQVYDDFTAVNGAAGVAYVDKMNRNTSAGFPWRCSKKFYLNAIEPRGMNLNPVEPYQEIKDRVNEILSKYHMGQMSHPVFTASFKDEPVTFAKANEHATRVFMGAPMDFSIVVRKYYLSMIRLIQKNKNTFECGAGTIAQSDEWHNLREWLTCFGEDKIVAGDYSKFDKRMSASIMRAAFNLMITLMIKSGNFDSKDVLVLECIAYDISYPMVDYFGDLVQFNGCNPSGHPLTVIINSIANSIYMRYVYFILNPNHELDSFGENVHLMTYGDDNIMGVNDNAPWFNHTDIAGCLAEFGIKYTMADKNAISKPYIHIDEASFLKRTWSYCPDMKRYLCKLEEESINKSLTMWVPSKTICAEEQAVAIMYSAVLEYFFYGKEIFEKQRAFLLKVVKDNDLQLYYQAREFPTWIDLHNKYIAASEKIARPEYQGLNQIDIDEDSLLLEDHYGLGYIF